MQYINNYRYLSGDEDSKLERMSAVGNKNVELYQIVSQNEAADF